MDESDIEYPWDKFTGKTVAMVEYGDKWHEGIVFRFTDGSWVRISERMQVGELQIEGDVR